MPGAPSVPARAAEAEAVGAALARAPALLGATNSLGSVGTPACGRAGAALGVPGAISAPGGGARSQPARETSSSADAKERAFRGRVLGRGIEGKAFPGFFPQSAGAIHFCVIFM